MSKHQMQESRLAHKLMAEAVAETLQQLEGDNPAATDLLRRYVASLRAENAHYRIEARDSRAALAVQAVARRTIGTQTGPEALR